MGVIESTLKRLGYKTLFETIELEGEVNEWRARYMHTQESAKEARRKAAEYAAMIEDVRVELARKDEAIETLRSQHAQSRADLMRLIRTTLDPEDVTAIRSSLSNIERMVRPHAEQMAGDSSLGNDKAGVQSFARGILIHIEYINRILKQREEVADGQKG